MDDGFKDMPGSSFPETGDSAGSIDHHAGERLSYRYATGADISRYYGSVVPWTVRAIMAFEGDEAIGVIGLKRQAGCWEFFSDFREEKRQALPRITCMRAVKAAMQLVRACEAPVIAFVENEPDGHRMLERLGFKQIHGGYLWPS